MFVGAAAGAAAAAAASITAPVQGIFFLPPWPAHGEPAPNSLTHPHPAHPAYTPTRRPQPRLLGRAGDPGRQGRGGRPGIGGRRPGGDAGKTGLGGGREPGWDRAAPEARASEATVRPPALQPARPPVRPPRRRKRRRLGSAHAQFKLSPRPPPLPSPRPPRPGPAASGPPRSPLQTQGAPRLVRRSPSARASRAWAGIAGGRGLRLTHGAAVDAPLLGSSGSRTDRHPLPLRDQPRRGAAGGFSNATYADSAA